MRFDASQMILEQEIRNRYTYGILYFYGVCVCVTSCVWVIITSVSAKYHKNCPI